MQGRRSPEKPSSHLPGRKMAIQSNVKLGLTLASIRELDEIRVLVMTNALTGSVRKVALAASIKDEIAGWERRLQEANQNFMASNACQ